MVIEHLIPPEPPPSQWPWRRRSAAAVGLLVLQPASRPRRTHGISKESAVNPVARSRIIFIFWWRWLKNARRNSTGANTLHVLAYHQCPHILSGVDFETVKSL